MLKNTVCYKENVGMKVYLMNFSRKLLLAKLTMQNKV